MDIETLFLVSINVIPLVTIPSWSLTFVYSIKNSVPHSSLLPHSLGSRSFNDGVILCQEHHNVRNVTKIPLFSTNFFHLLNLCFVILFICLHCANIHIHLPLFCILKTSNEHETRQGSIFKSTLSVEDTCQGTPCQECLQNSALFAQFHLHFLFLCLKQTSNEAFDQTRQYMVLL